MAQQVKVDFNIGTSGGGEAALRKYAEAAKAAAQAEKELKEAADARRKASLQEARESRQSAFNKVYSGGSPQDAAKFRAADARVKKMEADEERKLMTEKAAHARKMQSEAKKALDDEAKARKQMMQEEERYWKDHEAKREKAEAKAAAKARDANQARQTMFQQSLVMGHMGGAAGVYGNLTGMGQTAQLAGYGKLGKVFNKAALPAAGAAAALAGGKGFMEMAAKIETVQRDEHMTSDQRSKSFWKEMPVTGWFHRIDDTITGRTRAMERGGEQANIDEQVRQVRQRERGARLDFANQSDAAQAMVNATAGARAGAGPTADRSTALGRQVYREQAALLPLQDEEAKSARESAAARATSVSAQKRLNELEAEGARLVAKRQELAKQEAAAPQGPQRLAVQHARDRLESDIQANLEMQRSQASHVTGSKQQEAAAAQNQRQRAIAVESGKLSILEQREQTASDQAANLGMMGQGGRMQATMALRMAKTMGLNNLPPEMIQAAASIAPNTIRAMAEKEGGAHAAELKKLAPDDYRDDLATVRKDVDKQRDKVRDMKIEDEKKTAKEMADALKPMGDSIKTFAVEMKSVIDQLTNQLRLQRTVKTG